MEKDSKIYVAGHTGLVGSAIVRKLVSEGYTNIIGKTSSELDLRNQFAVRSFFEREKPEYVFLAAAKVGGIYANNTYPAEFIYDNMMMESNVIHTSYRNRVRKLLFLGSSCIYPKDCMQPIKEEYLLTGPLEPTNEAYALAKISGLKMCDYYRKQYGCNFISAMPTNLYGPNDNFDLETSHVFPAILRKIYLAKCLMDRDFKRIHLDLQRCIMKGYNSSLSDIDISALLEQVGILNNGSRLLLWGSGQPMREFLHVDDAANACIHLMNLYSDYGHINVGTGKDISISDLANTIKGLVGYSGEIDWDKSKPDGTSKKLLNVDRIKKLGWKHLITLDNGIEELLNAYINK